MSQFLLDDAKTKHNTLTAIDFLREQELLELEAAEALPHAIEKCSAKRVSQPIYACLSCKGLGVCYACFVRCHTTHDAVDVGMRRDFRCDCWNSPDGCSLRYKNAETPEDKDTVANNYNNNFKGIFCFCKSVYDPEKESALGSEMLQCLVCEDWFHDRCIPDFPAKFKQTEDVDDAQGDQPEVNAAGETFSDFICSGCVMHNSYLLLYTCNKFLFVPEVDGAPVLSANRDGESGGHVMSPEIRERGSKRKREESVNGTGTQMICKIGNRALQSSLASRNLFLLPGWKSYLCNCSSCVSKYAQNGVSHFILETNDAPDSSSDLSSSTVHSLEIDNDAHKSLLECGMEALNKVPRVQAIEGVWAYNRLSAFAKEYFASFAAEGKVVTKDDIENMFAELHRTKPK